MIQLQKVNFRITSIYNLDLDFLVKLEKNFVLIDLDNTLAPYNVMVPSAQTYELIQAMQDKGLIPLIISNNHKKRVKPYCAQLRVKYLHSANKPWSRKTRRFLKEMGIEPSDVVVIGDQLLNDAKLARKLDATMILTDPLVKKDKFITKINRLIERPLRRRYLKKNMLGRVAESLKKEVK